MGLVFCLLGLVSLSAAARIPFDFSTILAAMAVLVFGTYDITAVFAALEAPSSSSPEEWAAALHKAFRDRSWGLTVNTLTTGLVMLAFTVSSYRSDTALLASFAFPLLTGLIFALFAGLILVPLLWYELRFGRHSSQESQPDAEA